MQKSALRIYAKLFALISLIMLIIGCQLPSPGTDNESPHIITGVKASLSGAKGLVTLDGGSPRAKEIRGAKDARGITASLLVKVLEDGQLESVLTPQNGVQLPEIDFIAVHPSEGSLYIAFKSALTYGTNNTATFIRILPDETIEAVESEHTIHKFHTEEWESRQDPVVFGADGSIYYTISTGTNIALRKYGNGIASTLTAEVPTDILRFFTDGENVFFLGKNRTELNQATYVKVLEPGSTLLRTIMSSNAEGCWIKDIFANDSSVILSGWGIIDPEIRTRRYDGVLELRHDAISDEWVWKQLYGSATDSANPNFKVNRRQLKPAYFMQAGIFDRALFNDFVAPFFISGIVPDEISPFEIIDIDKVTLDALKIPAGVEPKLEHKFWFGLLSQYSGFDENFFYTLFLRMGHPDGDDYDGALKTNPLDAVLYPAGSGAEGVILEAFVFDALFGTNRTTSYSFVGDGAEFIEKMRSQTSEYFSSISLKPGAVAPLAVEWNKGSDLVWFKEWLNANFTYTLKTDGSLDSTSLYWPLLMNYQYVPTTLHSLFLAMTEKVYAKGSSGLAFKALYKNDDGTLDTDAVLEFVRKFYPSVSLKGEISTVLPLEESWTNSNEGKKSALQNSFALGSPRISAAKASEFPWAFYDYNTNQGLVTNPYVNLNLGTLFDSFGNLNRFTFTSDGSMYGVFKKSLEGSYKLVKLLDGITGDIQGKVILPDISASGFDFAGEKLYYSKTIAGNSANALIEVNIPDGIEKVVISESAGLEFYYFTTVSMENHNTALITALDTLRNKTMIIEYDAMDGSLVYYDQEGINTESDIEFYGSI